MIPFKERIGDINRREEREIVILDLLIYLSRLGVYQGKITSKSELKLPVFQLFVGVEVESPDIFVVIEDIAFRGIDLFIYSVLEIALSGGAGKFGF
ncbi:MAG: hypothetical protein ACMUEM_00095 [Flavobacteriales bacterium AspAUS03]